MDYYYNTEIYQPLKDQQIEPSLVS